MKRECIKCIYLLFSIQHQQRISRHTDCLGFARKHIIDGYDDDDDDDDEDDDDDDDNGKDDY